MKRTAILTFMIAGLEAAAVVITAPGPPQILWGGDVMPMDPPSWSGSTAAYIGNIASGYLTIKGGAAVYDYTACIGYAPQATGTVTVTGADSSWINASWLSVGEYGTGELNISNGGSVYNYDGYIGYAPGSTGQVTVDGAGSTWMNSSWLSVGEYGAGMLMITNGGSVYNYDGYVGYTPYGTGMVTVTGSESVWSNASVLLVGTGGSGTLNIENGGTVYNTEGYVGYDSDSKALVTGTGSAWHNSSWLSVGEYGIGELVIRDGGRVYSSEGYVGYNPGATGTVTVAGSGSVWSNAGYLGIGDYGTGTLNVEDGGVVYSGSGCLGFSGVDGNVTVTGDGSAWFNSGYLYIGQYGKGTLIITNGGAVYSEPSYVGLNHGSSGFVSVSGAGSIWSNSSNLTLGLSGTSTLEISDGGSVYSMDGTLGLYSNSVSVVTIEGPDSTWSIYGSLNIGDEGRGTLDIENGGAVYNADGHIGGASGSTGLVSVAGVGSIWSNSANLYVGDYGTGKLTISDGGAVYNDYGYIGYQSGSTGSMVVAGEDSVWSNADHLFVGCSGSGSLVITNGGTVYSRLGRIGTSIESVGSVTVTDSDSAWYAQTLFVGDLYGEGSLIITNNGRVEAGIVYVGRNSTNHNGSVSFGTGGVLDADTLCFSPEDFYGTGTATVRGVVSDMDVVFDGSSQTTNMAGDVTVLIDAQNMAGALGAGWSDEGSLLITNGAVVNSVVGTLGFKEGSFGSAVITGSNSVWRTRSLRISNIGRGEVTIKDSGTVFSDAAIIGRGGTGSMKVIGTGSVWSNRSSLFIGLGGEGSLIISNGAAVYSDSANIASRGGTGRIHVSGTGSSWENSGDVFLAAIDETTIRTNRPIRLPDPGPAYLTVDHDGVVDIGGSLVAGTNSSVSLADGGQLNVAGNATFAAGALLGFELSDENGTGKMTVNGTLINNGATIKITSSEALKLYSEYELIDADSIEDLFRLFDTNNVLSVYDLSLSSTATNVMATIHGLKLQETDTPSVAKAFAASANVVMHNVSKYAGVTRALLRGENPSGSTPEGASGPASLLASGEWAGYMHQFNDLGGQESEGTLDGFDWQTSGYLAGVEKLVNPQLIIGFGAGQAWTDLDGLRGSGGGSTDIFITSLYGNWFSENVYCEFGLLYARADNDVERTDTALDHYTGNYDSDMFGGWVEAGWLARKTEVTELEPYVRSTYISGRQESYTDEGGPSPMTVSANGTDNWQVEGGARLSRRWNLENSKPLRLELKAGVQCELLDNSVTVNTEVIGFDQRASSPEADRAAFILGARADLGLTDALNIGVGYEPTFSGNWQNHLVDFTLKYEF